MTKIQQAFFSGVFALLFSGSVSADSIVNTNDIVHSSANLSYKVAGKRYYPQKSVQGFSQTGRASWYGAQFHGKRTSSGEKFDMNALTAAHRTLPIPSYVRVTNLSNGRSVIVRVNDRGPFHGSRIMDLSKGAAQKLGFVAQGSANVKIEVISKSEVLAMQNNKTEPATTTTQLTENIFVNLRTFDNEDEARRFMQTAEQRLIEYKMEQKAVLIKQDDAFVVRVGPFREQQHANEIHSRLQQPVI